MMKSHELAGALTDSAVAFGEIPDADCPRRCIARLWCGRAFRPRVTGGSAQKFCTSGHRQAFWDAARRWTMRAVETGLLSVDCLKANQTSVYAARGVFQSREEALPARSSD
jgi:hypothetical protein